MKRIYIVFLFFFSFSLFANNNWHYDSIQRQLFYKNQPFPPFSLIFCPLGTFDFIPFAKLPFLTYGWKKTQAPYLQIENEGATKEEWVKRGWLFSFKKPSNIPDDWIYFPLQGLWSNPDSFLKLYQFFNEFYEKIPQLDSNIYNRVKKDRFYTIITPKLDSSVKEVRVKALAPIIKVYQTSIKKEGKQELFIFYIKEGLEKEILTLQLQFILQNGAVKKKNYFLIGQNNTKLISY